MFVGFRVWNKTFKRYEEDPQEYGYLFHREFAIDRTNRGHEIPYVTLGLDNPPENLIFEPLVISFYHLDTDGKKTAGAWKRKVEPMHLFENDIIYIGFNLRVYYNNLNEFKKKVKDGYIKQFFRIIKTRSGVPSVVPFNPQTVEDKYSTIYELNSVWFDLNNVDYRGCIYDYYKVREIQKFIGE